MEIFLFHKKAGSFSHFRATCRSCLNRYFLCRWTSNNEPQYIEITVTFWAPFVLEIIWNFTSGNSILHNFNSFVAIANVCCCFRHHHWLLLLIFWYGKVFDFSIVEISFYFLGFLFFHCTSLASFLIVLFFPFSYIFFFVILQLLLLLLVKVGSSSSHD